MATTLDPLSSATSGNLSEQATQRKFWRKGAPSDIVSEKQWPLWSRHLQKRRAPKPLAVICQSDGSPLRWGLSISQLSPQTVEMLSLADQLQAKAKGKTRIDAASAVQALSGWLQRSRNQPQSPSFGIECLAVAHLLPAIAGEATEDLWWRFADELWEIVRSSAEWRAEAEMPADDALAQQIFTGELPLTLAYFFPEVRPLNRLRETAAEALSEGLVEFTNGEGLLRGPCLGILRPLLASWTRAQAIGRQIKKGCCNSKATEQFGHLVTQALTLSAPDGCATLGAPHAERWTPDFLAAVVRLGGGSLEASAAKRMFGKKLTRSVTAKITSRNPLTSDNCEWSGVAVMRAAWESDAPLLAVDYSSTETRLELWSNSQRIMAGIWESETVVDGKRLESTSAWENTCWFTDKDADYLELSLDLTDGARLERQILLTREDQILYVADNIHLAATGNLSHRLRLPLDAAVGFAPEEETREGLLTTDKIAARVLPLALPEWRSDPRFGQLTKEGASLELFEERPGKSLSCPLLIDFKRARAKKPCTWRQLTVAESLEILPHDVAVGYRAQCGKQQWLFYRSMGPCGNRTVIGQNLSTEFLAARFIASTGGIEDLVEIEG